MTVTLRIPNGTDIKYPCFPGRALQRVTLPVPAEQATVSGVRKVINPSKSKEGAQREMGQPGTPHGVPLSGNGMSPGQAACGTSVGTLSHDQPDP